MIRVVAEGLVALSEDIDSVHEEERIVHRTDRQSPSHEENAVEGQG